MASALCTNRLRKELRALQKAPVQNIRALPRETNILEWHYVIEGMKGTPFEGGWYHGIVTFPKEYPYKPPSIQMVTPNGRFKTCTALCLSMSDFHPESWNPLWSVGTILMGLHSFMLEHTPTQGSITTTDAAKRKFAAESLELNVKNKVFQELFPELVALHEARLAGREQGAAGADGRDAATGHTDTGALAVGGGLGLMGLRARHLALAGAGGAAGGGAGGGAGGDAGPPSASWASVLGVFAAVVCCAWCILTFAL